MVINKPGMALYRAMKEIYGTGGGFTADRPAWGSWRVPIGKILAVGIVYLMWFYIFYKIIIG